MATAKNLISVSSSRTQTANVQKQVCTEVGRCEYAREQAITRFSTLRRKLEAGGETGQAPYEALEKNIAEFNLQSGELPSHLDQLDLSEDELVDLWEAAGKLDNAVERFEENALDQERDLYTWLRNKPGIDNVPEEAQPLESVKNVTERVQTRAEQELREEHGVSKNELENTAESEEQTESESQKESQRQEKERSQTQKRHHRRR
jgi:hypothetical protein